MKILAPTLFAILALLACSCASKVGLHYDMALDYDGVLVLGIDE